jgi:hypothetical protein
MVNKVILVNFLDCWVLCQVIHSQTTFQEHVDFIDFILCTFLANLAKKFFVFFARFAGLCSDFDDELTSLLACDLQSKDGQINIY